MTYLLLLRNYNLYYFFIQLRQPRRAHSFTCLLHQTHLQFYILRSFGRTVTTIQILCMVIWFIFIIAMNSKPTKPSTEEQAKNGDAENIKEYWTEHRTTLIAFQAQYVFNKKPDPREDEENDNKNRKGKKKDIEFEGGFLFPGREGDKEINVVEMIKQSGKHSNLKQLFDESLNHSEDTQQLREFVKIMLELKHPCIVKQFLEIYDNIIKEIKDVKFDQIKAEQDRFAVIDKIRDKVAGFVNSNNHTFKNFSGYMRDDRLETMKLFKVTAYCFLAEKFNFNINEFYSTAFQFPETEKKKPTKKNKTQKEDTANS